MLTYPAHVALTSPISGVLIRNGDTITNYPDRHLGKIQADAISYHVRIDSTKAQPRTVDGWEHYSYVFTYRYEGRTMTQSWKCGTGHPTPTGPEGLEAAFADAGTIAWEFFSQEWAEGLGMAWDEPSDVRKAQRLYDACERTEHRLAAFLGDAREAWEEGIREY